MSTDGVTASSWPRPRIWRTTDACIVTISARRRDVLRARHRHQLVPHVAYVEGRIHPACTDGQSGELLRRLRHDHGLTPHDGRRPRGHADRGSPRTTTSHPMPGAADQLPGRRQRPRRAPGPPRHDRRRHNNAGATSITATISTWHFGWLQLTANQSVTVPYRPASRMTPRSSKTRHRQRPVQIQYELSLEQPRPHHRTADLGIKSANRDTTTDTTRRWARPNLEPRARGSTTTSTNANFWVRARPMQGARPARRAAAAVIRIDHLRVTRPVRLHARPSSVFTPDTACRRAPYGAGPREPSRLLGHDADRRVPRRSTATPTPALLRHARTSATKSALRPDQLLQLRDRDAAGSDRRQDLESTTRASVRRSVGMGTGDRWFEHEHERIERGHARSTSCTTRRTRCTTRPTTAPPSPRAGPSSARPWPQTDPSWAAPRPVRRSTCNDVPPRDVGDGRRHYHNHWYQLTSRMTGAGTGRHGLPAPYDLHRSDRRQRPEEHRRPEQLRPLSLRPPVARRRIYGIGAMEALLAAARRAPTVSTFYLAQIEAGPTPARPWRSSCGTRVTRTA